MEESSRKREKTQGDVRFAEIENVTSRNTALPTGRSDVSEDKNSDFPDRGFLIAMAVVGQSDWGPNRGWGFSHR